MQPIPLIFRQSLLRSSVNLTRTTKTTTAASKTSTPKSIATSATRTARTARPIAFLPPGSSQKQQWLTSARNNNNNNNNNNTYSAASVCLRCQFRGRYYSVQAGGKGPEGENNDSMPLKRDGNGDVDGEVQGVFLKKDSEKELDSLGGEKGGLDLDSKIQQEQQRQEQKYQYVKEENEEDGSGSGNGNGNGNGNNRGLPSQIEKRRSDLSKQFTRLMDNMQSNIFIAGQRLNDLTGYSGIEKLKQDILTQEQRVRETRTRVHEAKEAYSAAINRRSTSQREVNELLQRKHAWSPTDLERFTSLYRSDHANERAETDAQEALMVAEREAEEAAAVLSKSILSRYHEEQIWSDKIRRMSTWGTWGLMGVNVLLFLIFQVAVEPWRRRRLVKGFEEKVMEALDRENGTKQGMGAEGTTLSNAGTVSSASAAATATPTQIAEPAATAPTPMAAPISENIQPGPSDTAMSSEQEVLDPAVVPATEPSLASLQPTEQSPSSISVPTSPLLPPDVSLSPDSWRQTIHDLFSERHITLSQRELTTVALESAAAGAAVMGVLIAMFRPR